MKTDFLKELGLEQDAIDKVMAEHGKSMTATKAATEIYKKQLTELGEKLKAFDGVDVEAMRGEAEKLKADLAAKESEFAQKQADRDFADVLGTAIRAAKGKNEKSVSALLDIETLKASKNQQADVAAAVKALTESDAYLFDSATATTTTKMSTGGTHNEGGSGGTDPFDAACDMYKKKE